MGRGVYTLADQTISEHRSLAEVAIRVPRGVICLLSALRVHDIGTQAPHEVWLAIPHRMPAPRMRAYPKYTVFAEKLQALCVFGMSNSRMKDYFDMWILLRDGELDDAELARAIRATFARRGTAMPEGVPVGLSDMFATDESKQSQWRAFANKNKLNVIPLNAVIQILRSAFQRLKVF